MIVTFLPAAGASSRMRGRDKLLERVDGVPLLRLVAARALEAGIGPVLVGVPPGPHPRRDALDGLDIGLVDVPDARDGLSATLRAGARATLAIGAAEAMMVALPDMPEITVSDLSLLAETYDGGVLRATTEDGAPGHPTVFPRRLLAAFDTLTGDRGAASLMTDARTLTLPGQRARCDLDTPETWAAWREGR